MPTILFPGNSLRLLCAIAIAVCQPCARGAQPPRSGTPIQTAPAGPRSAAAANPAFDALVKRLVLEHAPRFIEKADGWGHTKEIVSGLDVRFEHGELRTHRRHKQVNDGTWKWYRCELREPERDLEIHVTPRADAPDGAKQFDVATTARVHVQARWQKWENGVRLASISAEAKAVARLDLGCRVKIELDTAKFPPDLVVTPRVERAQVQLLDFDLDRVSALHGDLAEELGRVLRPTIEREIARRQGELLPKLNAKLAARQADLRFSLTAWIGKGWSSWWQPGPVGAGQGK